MRDETKELIIKWFHRSQLDYCDQYINLFIAYNAWFKKVTKKTKDRDAITALKLRVGIWEQYLNGETMQELTPYIREIAQITNEKALKNLTRSNDPHWNGIVESERDWKGLVEYWYRVRCNLFHGTKSPEDAREGRLIELAYKSLNVFMTEIVRRMENNFSSDDLDALFEISLLKPPEESSYDGLGKEIHARFWEGKQKEQKELEEKFKRAKNIWEIDL